MLLTTDLDAFLIHNPEDWKKLAKEELKSRFIKARQIPYHFVTDNKRDGGWDVLSQDKWNRINKQPAYHVYRTHFNTYICTCEDFIRTQKICKHAIRVLLARGRNAKFEKTKLDYIIQQILENPSKIYQVKT